MADADSTPGSTPMQGFESSAAGDRRPLQEAPTRWSRSTKTSSARADEGPHQLRRP